MAEVSTTDPATPRTCWEHALYLNAQNDLEGAAYQDTRELSKNKNAAKYAKGSTDPKYKLRVLVDRSGEFSTRRIRSIDNKYKVGNVVADYVMNKTFGGKLEEDTEWKHKNSSAMDPGVIAEFAKGSLSKESQCYQFLEFWDHGSGPFGYGSAEGEPDSEGIPKHLTLEVKQLEEILQKVVAHLGGRK